LYYGVPFSFPLGCVVDWFQARRAVQTAPAACCCEFSPFLSIATPALQNAWMIGLYLFIEKREVTAVIYYVL